MHGSPGLQSPCAACRGSIISPCTYIDAPPSSTRACTRGGARPEWDAARSGAGGRQEEVSLSAAISCAASNFEALAAACVGVSSERGCVPLCRCRASRRRRYTAGPTPCYQRRPTPATRWCKAAPCVAVPLEPLGRLRCEHVRCISKARACAAEPACACQGAATLCVASRLGKAALCGAGGGRVAGLLRLFTWAGLLFEPWNA